MGRLSIPQIAAQRSARGSMSLPRLHVAMLLLVVMAMPLSASRTMAAPSSLVVDVASGRALQESNADQRRYPASLTKMMTLYLLFDALDTKKLGLNSRLRVSRRAAAQPPSKLGLLPGRTIRVRDAILALATQSANDVAVAVGEALAGSEGTFAVRMTAKARSLGMERTTFRNASGLHNPQQQTTARDMALLGRALLRDHPRHYRRTFATQAFSYGRSRYRNHNRLLGVYRGMDGIKTGYTSEAGFNLVASAMRGNRRILGVVMGSPTAPSRNALMVGLLDRAFLKAPPGQGPIALRSQPRKSGVLLSARGSTARVAGRASRLANTSPKRTQRQPNVVLGWR